MVEHTAHNGKNIGSNPIILLEKSFPFLLFLMRKFSGKMAEWFKALVLKTDLYSV